MNPTIRMVEHQHRMMILAGSGDLGRHVENTFLLSIKQAYYRYKNKLHFLHFLHLNLEAPDG